MHLFIEAFLMGCAIVVLGNLVGLGMSYFVKMDDAPNSCKDWMNEHAMKGNIMLFLIGFFGHLIFEWSGVNGWYCREGNACRVQN